MTKEMPHIERIDTIAKLIIEPAKRYELVRRMLADDAMHKLKRHLARGQNQKGGRHD